MARHDPVDVANAFKTDYDGPIGALARAYLAIVNGPRSLTGRQREIFEFLSSHIETHGYAPTLQEVATKFGLRSLSSVHEHLCNLERRGWIHRGVNDTRAITIIRHASGTQEDRNG